MSNLNDIFFTPAANQELTYDQVLEDVQRYFAENHASTIAEAGEGNAERATSLLKELMEHYIVKRKYALDGLSTKELCSKLYEDMAGYSFLKKWIYKPGVEEVNINAYNDIEVIESSGRSIKIPDKFSSPQHAIDVIRRMLNACGMVIDDTMPSIVGFLDKNIRISVDKTPIVDADVGVNASIRIVNQQTVSEEKLLNSGSATAEMLHFLTACIRYGVSVCIAGSTGSGKTTLCNLIARFWDVTKGCVRIGGQDIRELNPDGLLHYISEVFQENTLLSDTIYNNIKAGREDATEQEVIAAAKAAHCHEFIERLPNGYQTHLAEGGNTLSGGEKQRIAIARAILKDAPILLLDESTASLDADNEAKINQALDRLMKGKTVFVIAHRLNTIQNADQIIVLNQGRIEETGTHEELLRKKGHYYEMVQEQQKAREWIVKGA